jgi:hypothetical protein
MSSALHPVRSLPLKIVSLAERSPVAKINNKEERENLSSFINFADDFFWCKTSP